MDKYLRQLPKKENEITTLEDILDDFRYVTDGFPRAAVKKAIAQQQEITPRLLTLLENVTLNYQSLEVHEIGHFYAMYLLAQFREKKAFPLIMKLANLLKDEETIDRIFGDVI